jgi:hypothetical protein
VICSVIVVREARSNPANVTVTGSRGGRDEALLTTTYKHDSQGQGIEGECVGGWCNPLSGGTRQSPDILDL